MDGSRPQMQEAHPTDHHVCLTACALLQGMTQVPAHLFHHLLHLTCTWYIRGNSLAAFTHPSMEFAYIPTVEIGFRLCRSADTLFKRTYSGPRMSALAVP